MKILTSAIIAASLSLATTLSAIPYNIDADDDLLGYVVPGTPADYDSATFQGNRLISLYNVPSGNGVYAPPVGDPTHADFYVLDIGSNIPAPTLGGLSGGTHVDLDDPTINLLGSTLSWVIGKYGNDNFLFYVGDLDYSTITSVVLPSQIQFDVHLGEMTGGKNPEPKTTKVGGGLSHYVTYPGDRTEVPDSGATIALLGAALVALGASARRSRNS